MIRKAALQIGVPALLAFMAWNAYLAVNHLEQMQKIAALTVESSKIQADISGVLKDLTDTETGQRVYLLTNDSSYVLPYSAENSSVGRLDIERNANLSKALLKTIVANSCLLVLTACLLGLIRYHAQVLEQEAAHSRQVLAVRDMQLEKLTSALSNQARSKTYAIEASVRLLLQNYGGFLPRQVHEYAEQIRQASAQVEQLRLE